MTKVHAVGATGEGDVGAIVDDHARSRSPADLNKIMNERREVGRSNRVADLNQIDTRPHSPLRLSDEAPASRIQRVVLPQTMAIGHEAEHAVDPQTAKNRGGPAPSPSDMPKRCTAGDYQRQVGKTDNQVHDRVR